MPGQDQSGRRLHAHRKRVRELHLLPDNLPHRRENGKDRPSEGDDILGADGGPH